MDFLFRSENVGDDVIATSNKPQAWCMGSHPFAGQCGMDASLLGPCQSSCRVAKLAWVSMVLTVGLTMTQFVSSTLIEEIR